ncbi:MAG: DUF2726 domain-containing protein [Nitrospirales bacterium]|nr:DUF2726 domain-containing protein [Nitrospirales bacterium]
MILDVTVSDMVLGITLIAIIVILLVQGFRLWYTPHPKHLSGMLRALPTSLTIQPRWLFTKSEIALYNLIRLAVQDNYLVLAKLPMRKLIKLESEHEADRLAFLRVMQKMILDIVLVHPGTRIPVWIIQVECTQDTDHKSHLVDKLFQKAGIDVLRLQKDISYTLPELVNLLRLKEDD